MNNQTNWIVLSGVTNSGKTTIANLLTRYGYKAPLEVARLYINELRTRMTQEKLSAFAQTYEFQYEIARRSLEFEQNLDSNEFVIIDCSLMDTLIYFKLRGYSEQFKAKGHDVLLQEHLKHYRYHRVFLFEKLPCDDDPYRFGTDETLRDQAHLLLKEESRKQGYTPIVVPLGSIEERLEFILKKLQS